MDILAAQVGGLLKSHGLKDQSSLSPLISTPLISAGTYSASQNIPTLTLQNVPHLQELAPSVFTEAKTAAMQAHEPVALDTSNGTWNTAMILAGATVTQLTSFLSASAQSLFGMDNSATLAEMNEAQQVMNTIGFDINAGGHWISLVQSAHRSPIRCLPVLLKLA